MGLNALGSEDMSNASLAACLLIVCALTVSLAAVATPAHSAETPQATGSISARKTIESVSADNKVSLLLTVVNNGTIPVFDLEIYEYTNVQLEVQGSILVITPWGRSQVPVAPGGLVSINQVIIDPTPPNTLNPGQQLQLRYTQVAQKAGDFQVPTSLVWYSYRYGGSTIRLSIYSNGMILHVPNAVEKAVVEIYPYVLSATTFVSTITLLIWVRARLSKIKRSKLT